MKTLNEIYNNSCNPGNQIYKKISNEITLINNFFEDFDSARNFFLNRDKWNCISYQDHSKPGYESVFPKWIGRSLMEKYVTNNKINDDINSYKIVCNFFYDQSDFIWSISNSNYFPHIDNLENNNILKYICLTNLNLIPVETNFYSFRSKEFCDLKNFCDWEEYKKKIKKELINYYNKETITRQEFKLFLDYKKELDIKLIRTVKYNPNQSIVYPANLFHSPHVTSKFTEDNPRVILRVSFDAKTTKNKIINYS